MASENPARTCAAIGRKVIAGNRGAQSNLQQTVHGKQSRTNHQGTLFPEVIVVEYENEGRRGNLSVIQIGEGIVMPGDRGMGIVEIRIK
jgi:hypothetical protein